MTSSTVATNNRSVVAAGNRGLARRPGFTLIEMLVVIGIIVALGGMLLPAVNNAYKAGVRTRMMLDLQTIAVGLDAYKADHNSYPIIFGDPKIDSGAKVLGRCMIAPGPEVTPTGVTNPKPPQIGDGADGPGFRTRAKVGAVFQGKAYGPYIPTDKFPINEDGEILDFNNSPILYYVGRVKVDIANPNTGYVKEVGYAASNQSMFNSNDNLSRMPTKTLQVLLGDLNGTNIASSIDGSEVAAFKGEYLLWAADPTGVSDL